MANLFLKQAKKYVDTRPTYPLELFQFIASKCPRHDLAWDVGTGNGQAAVSLAGMFKDVVATDTSRQQLEHAAVLPNIRYQYTPPTISTSDLSRDVAAPGTVDLVTVAQAIHWFDHKTFYSQANHLLRRPGGVLAAWCYTLARVDGRVDPVFERVYKGSASYWAPQRRYVEEELRTIEFPYEPVEGETHTGPFEFETAREMDLDVYLTYIRSWSAYQTALDSGADLLGEEVVAEFERAWGGDREEVKVVRFPVFLRIGRVNGAA